MQASQSTVLSDMNGARISFLFQPHRCGTTLAAPRQNTASVSAQAAPHIESADMEMRERDFGQRFAR
jgi:hypothetical protein